MSNTTYRACRDCGTPFGIETTGSRRGICTDCLYAQLRAVQAFIEEAEHELSWRHGKGHEAARRKYRIQLKNSTALKAELTALRDMK